MFGVLLLDISCYENSEVALRQNRLLSLLCVPIILFWSLCFQSLSISICIGFVQTRQTWCGPSSAFLWDSFLISIMACSNAFYAMCSQLRLRRLFLFFCISLPGKVLLEVGGSLDLILRGGGSPAASVVILERCCRLQIFQKKQLQNVQPAAA